MVAETSRSRPDTPFPILVATDGSGPGRAAVAGALAFPWPAGTRVHGVLARRGFSPTRGAPDWPEATWDALDRVLDRIRKDAEAALARRWPGAKVEIVDRPPVEGILEVADAVGARAVVLGSRGYGPIRRLLLGSVSRGVVRDARCPVLVVKGSERPGRRLVLGLDGSAHAQKAVEFLAGLSAPYGGRITALRVVEPVRVPSMGLVPASMRATIRAQAAALTAQALEEARREVETAAARLAQGALAPARWRVRPAVREGVPLDELLRAVRARADCLVLGARGVGGMERLLLGSVAEGALSRSPVSVLVVR
jgi:nucleotide-binding universal stress UspA family protein